MLPRFSETATIGAIPYAVITLIVFGLVLITFGPIIDGFILADNSLHKVTDEQEEVPPPPVYAGRVVGWGHDNFGQSAPPVGLKAVAIAAGNVHFLALKSDGTVVGWGENCDGQCDPPAGLKATAIAAGSYQSLAATSDGAVVGWGITWVENEYSVPFSAPPNLTGVRDVALGIYDPSSGTYGMALLDDGTVVAWNPPHWEEDSYHWMGGLSLTDVVAIDGSGTHFLALKSDGTVVAIDRMRDGSGDAFLLNLDVTEVTAIAAGMYPLMGIILKTDGSAWIVVDTGDGICDEIPLKEKNVAALALSETHHLLLKGDGSVVADPVPPYGENAFGECNVPTGLRAIAVAAGDGYSLAIVAGDSVAPQPAHTQSSGLPYSEQRGDAVQFILMCWKALAFVGVLCVVIFLLMNGSQESTGGI